MGVGAHVGIVERMGVRRRRRVEEGRVLAVRHLVGANVVVVAHTPVAGAVGGVVCIANEDGVDVDIRESSGSSGSGGSGQKASREEGVVDRFHECGSIFGDVERPSEKLN